MFRVSNAVLGIINFFTLLLSIPILGAGIWLRLQGRAACFNLLDTPLIVLGGFMLLLSLAGLIGECCRMPCLLWIFLVLTFIHIVLILSITIFGFVVTNKGAGGVTNSHRLGDYSQWLEDRVINDHNWGKVKSCFIENKVCSHFDPRHLNVPVTESYAKQLSAVQDLQSGCCKPPDDCGFRYENQSTWISAAASKTNPNPDCNLWNNRADVLCFDCNSCKAGLLQDTKTNWKKVALVNISFLVSNIIIYCIGCCAFRNIRSDDNARSAAGWKHT